MVEEKEMNKVLFWGSGALNVDYFYAVEDLAQVTFRGKPLRPGGEVWGTRDEVLALRECLEKSGKQLACCGGGSAANTLYALKSWGFRCGFVGWVGEDKEGDLALAELEGMELSQVRRLGHTSCSVIVLDAKRDRAIVVCAHSEEKTLAQGLPPRLKGHLHLSSLVTQEGLEFHRRLTQAHTGTISLDPGEIYASRGLKALEPILKRTNRLFITHQELDLLKVSPAELLAQGVGEIFLKKGAQGAEVWQDQKVWKIPPEEPPCIIDNTGAGDVFDAGVLAGLALELSAEAAARLGATLAALSLRNYGRLGFPSQEEFEALCSRIKSPKTGLS